MGPATPRHLAITYANERLRDGAGAQLQRIYGIYAVSRFLDVPYVHSPIGAIGYQGLEALENNSGFEHLLSEYNRVFHIPSDMDVPEKRATRDLVHADIEFIKAIRSSGYDGAEFSLIRILFPYAVTDKYPESYRFAKAVSPFQYRGSAAFRLAIHVRRGELYVVDSHRMLPNSYYVSCALAFQEILSKLNIPFVCELYTETARKKFEVTPQHHGIFGRISQNTVVDPANDRLEDFDVISNLKKYVNLNPIETLRRMATADALILSVSSFSTVAAILSPNCIVLCCPPPSSPMKDWLTWGKDGKFPTVDVVKRVLSWKRARSQSGSLPAAAPSP
jgi:hypothetical protein